MKLCMKCILSEYNDDPFFSIFDGNECNQYHLEEDYREFLNIKRLNKEIFLINYKGIPYKDKNIPVIVKLKNKSYFLKRSL